MADFAIHETTLTDIADTIRKKDGTQALIDPADYADRINLMGMLEEKTASSSSICSFSDGADDVPMSSVVAHVDTTQDGIDEIKMVQTGKNLLDDSLKGISGHVIWFGHTSGNRYDKSVFLKKGTYTLSVETADGVVTNLYIFNSNTQTAISGFPAYNTKTKTFTLSEDTECAVNVYRQEYVSVSDILTAQIEIGSTSTDYEPLQENTYTINLGRTIHGGQADIVNGAGTDENGDGFTFDGQKIPSLLGVNNLWHDAGETEAVYRASGTITPIQPVLVSKNITANGTYTASDDGADGYDTVSVNVPSIQSISVHSGKLNIKTGAITADADYCYTDEIECPNGWMRMDFGETSNGDFIGLEMLDNGTHTNYWVANARFRSIDLSSYYSATKTIRLAFRKTYADVVVFIDYSHSKLYSPFTMFEMQEASASLLSMMPSEEANENTEEVE